MAFDLISTLQRAGFKGDALRTAYAIGMRESGGRPEAYNPNRSTGDDSYGLFQINMLGNLGADRRRRYGLQSNSDLYDPLTNASVAYKLSKGGTDFGAWGIGPNAYRSGAGFDTIKRWYDSFPGAVPPVSSPAPVSAPVVAKPSAQSLSRRQAIVSALLSDNDDAFFSAILSPAAEQRAQQWGGTTKPPVSPRTGAIPQSRNPQMNTALQIAVKQLGKPYVWGAESPELGFDCSGLIEYAFEQAGIKTPGRLTTWTIANYGKSVKGQQFQPGDMILTNKGKHVVLYLGDGKVIAAPRRGEPVQIQPVSRFNGQIVDVRRV